MIHQLKTWPEYYSRVLSGEKTFEIRINDRDFQTGDYLHLQEWDPKTESFTGCTIMKEVTYILHGGRFGIESGVVVMGIR